MEEFQPILLEDIGIDVPGFRIRRIALNQHMPRVEKLSEHRHEFHQALLYLRGGGTQHISELSLPVARGDWLVIPPRVPHRFAKEKSVRPVCLAMDFLTEEKIFSTIRKETISKVELGRVEKWLVQLYAERAKSKRPTLTVSTLILKIANLLEESLTHRGQFQPGRTERLVRRAMEELGPGGTPGAIAQRLGMSLDHLNRLLRAETGLTVGACIRNKRLERAGELLKDTARPISEIASEVGIDDQNYFGRWFRKYTGQTPTAWREAMRQG